MIYNYCDYISWPDEQRWEIIDGMPFNMSPAPSTKHQTISVNLVFVFKNYLKDKSCKVFSAPFDVRLTENKDARNEDIETVVQPDISVFCDPSKIDEKGAIGSPDLVIEILSPSTANKDLYEKLLTYQKYKVKEYIIVDPNNEEIMISILDMTGKYNIPKRYSKGDIIPVKLFPDLKVEGKDVFES